MSAFTQALVVSPLDDGKTWALMRGFRYARGSETSDDVIEVPAGFLTDFASVPWWAQWFLPKWGKYGNAAVVHDWLYWEQRCTRREADAILLEAMGVMAVGPIRKRVIYHAVRAFGQIAWMRNREDRRCGFSRVRGQLDFEAGTQTQREGTIKQVTTAILRRTP
jgi:Protein of unknown function (DUF1353)